MLVEEMAHMDLNILGISEMRWKGIGDRNDRKSVHGVGFLVNKNTRISVMVRIPVNNRIITIRVAGTPFNMTIVQVYAPTSDCSEEVMDEKN